MYTEKLAAYYAKLKFEEIPSEVLAVIKLCLLDTLGVIIAASQTNEASTYFEYANLLTQKAEATIIGINNKNSITTAAFVNGTLCELIELQDGYTKGGLHPSSAVIPAVLAQAEQLNSNGDSFLTAIMVGYEIANRVGGAMHASHLNKGFQPTGTVGTIGAAAGIGKLFGFDAITMKNCLGVAGFILPISTGDNLWGGYTVKPVHGGQAARSGIEAAYLARLGLTAAPLEGDPNLNRGFCSITCDKPNLAKLSEKLGEYYTTSDVYFKPYPSCRQTHAAIDAVLHLVTEQDIYYKNISEIIVRTFNFAANIPGQIYPEPNSSLFDFQFSIPYCVAVVAIDRSVKLERFIDKAKRADKEVHLLASKVKVFSDEEMESLRPGKMPAEVEILTDSGQKFLKRIEIAFGAPPRLMTENEVVDKFEQLVFPILNKSRARKVVGLINEIEKYQVKDLIEAIKF